MEDDMFKLPFGMWQSLGKGQVRGGYQQLEHPVPLPGDDLRKADHTLGKKVTALMGVKGAGEGPGQ